MSWEEMGGDFRVGGRREACLGTVVGAEAEARAIPDKGSEKWERGKGVERKKERGEEEEGGRRRKVECDRILGLLDRPGRGNEVVQEAENSVKNGAHLRLLNEGGRSRETRIAHSASALLSRCDCSSGMGVGEGESELGADLTSFLVPRL